MGKDPKDKQPPPQNRGSFATAATGTNDPLKDINLPKDYLLTAKQVFDILSRSLSEQAQITVKTWVSTSNVSFEIKDPATGLDTSWTHDTSDNTISFTGWDYDEQHQGKGHLKRLLADRLVLAQRTKVKQLGSLFGHTGAYAFARARFLPKQSHWDDLRRKCVTNLDLIANRITPDMAEKAESILNNPDPRAIWALARLDTKIDGKTLGWHLLAGNQWHGTVKFDRKDQMAELIDYIGQDTYKAAQDNADKATPSQKKQAKPPSNDPTGGP